MIDNATHSDGLVIAARLKEFLETPGLDERIRDSGVKLHRRVTSPVRVTIFGRPGSGKSQMLNMLLGRTLIPDGLHPPTMSMHYGRDWKLRLTLPNGQMEELAKFDLEEAVAKNPVFLDMEAPIEALKTLALTELIAKGGKSEQKAAVSWAVRRTDICLWCTTDFDEQDAELWQNVPDHIKDHAYLVLTKAELWAERGELEARMAKMANVASEEFHSFYAVAALQGLAACKDGMLADEALWRGSGGEALVTALYDHAARGRQQDFDAADAFLYRYESLIPKQPEPKPQPKVAPPASRVDEDGHLTKAREFLRDSTREFGEITVSFGKETAPEILSHCLEIATELSDILAPLIETPANTIVEDADRAAEMITLLMLEGGTSPAVDAICLLAQISQDIEKTLAA